MEFVGLDYKTYADRSPFRLSGGQMRRVAIAGVIAIHPQYLILDEPSAGLGRPGAGRFCRNPALAPGKEYYGYSRFP